MPVNKLKRTGPLNGGDADQARWRRQVQKTLLLESLAVARQARHIDRDFLKVAQWMARCQGRVVVMGVGKSGLIGRKLAATLSSTGTPSFFVHPTEGLHGDLGMVVRRDVALILSYSGETEELKKILAVLRQRKIPLVAMTGRSRSMLGQAADLVINVAVEKEACPYNITPTASTTAMLAMGDALALLIMEIKGFGKEDFARLHPGGALGKRLTLRVQDVMHKGEANPLVSQEKKVREALWTMTKTRLGAASVVDGRGRLVGVFTDGDLRRGLQKDPDLLNRPLSEVMTRSPRTLSPDTLAAEVSSLFRKWRLDNFPVVDGNGRPVGVLDEKDLLEEGLD
jgi:arabinose-5-phosphate isomerase